MASAIWASRESDQAALERQRELVNDRMHSQISSVATELELMAQGYASYVTGIVVGDRTEALAADSFENIITTVFGYERTFVVWADGSLAVQGELEADNLYTWVEPLLSPMLDRAVETNKSRTAAFEAKPVIELLRLQGRPSIAGIMPLPIAPDANIEQNSVFLIAYRYIDGPALDSLSREQGLNGARFARSSDPGPDEVSFQIDATSSQEPIGFVIWTPDLPGSKVVVRLIPALATSAAIISLLLSLLILLLRKSLADLKDSERKARHQSMHDVLTGLPNRALFGLRLTERIDDQRLNTTRTVVALVDLDKFKAVNDTLGHGAGDELITAVASRILPLINPEDMLARLGGDEFALLLPDRAKSDDSYLHLCDRIIEAISLPFALLDGTVTARIGCSIGITTLSSKGQTVSEVLHLADVALYQAKLAGRGRRVEYTAGMEARGRMREELRADLRRVLDNNEASANKPESGLAVFFQTTHSAAPGNAISGAEALVRWYHPKYGLLSPDQFIPLAEESGLIHMLGNIVLRRSCAAAMTWPNEAFVSVNVSPSQLQRPEFADEVLHILDQTGLPPDRLELEVTETALMDGRETSVEAALSRLRGHGVKIALDDFGTGYSSLSHLVQFGIDRIKIDKSFVQLLGTRSDGATIVSAIIALSQSLGLTTTAEGVETIGQRDFLIAAGCNDLQGYLFSRPAPHPAMTGVSPTSGFAKG